MTRLFAAIAMLSSVAACSPADLSVSAGAETGPVLSYTDAFVIEPIAGRDMTRGGVTLAVMGGDVRLIGASSDAIGAIEMHTMTLQDTTMVMRQVDGFDIGDGETLALAQGGHHFMMFNLSADIRVGETVDILLSLDANGSPMTLVIEADVKALGE